MKVDPVFVPALQRLAARQADLLHRANKARQNALYHATVAHDENRGSDEFGWRQTADTYMDVMNDAAATHDRIVGLLGNLADA